MESSEVSLTISSHCERLFVILILAAVTILSGGFSLGPILEEPDELEQYRFVSEFARVHTLPDVQQPGEEFSQPSLCYSLAALIKAPVDDMDFDRLEVNPCHLYHNHGELFILGGDNKNHLIHIRAESFPFTQSGAALVHLACERILSTCVIG